MASYDLRREVVVAKFQTLLDLIAELDGNTDEIEAKLQSIINLLTSIDAKVATEATLLILGTTANSIESLLTSLNAKDFATETTLAALKVTADNLLVCCQSIDTKQDTIILELQAIKGFVDGIETLLASIDGKVATEVTLAAIKAQTDLFTFTGGDLNVNATVTIPPGLATEATLAAIKAQTDQLTFTANKLRTTGEDGGAGGGAPFLIFGTTTPLGASATYQSGVLSLVGKSQVETRVLSDTDGTLVFDFYEDAGGTDLIRSLSIPYVGGSGYQYFAAPAFSNYVEYSFINSGTPQTDFLYETKVLTTAISGQIVRLDGTIASGMVAPVTRSVFTGITPTGNYQNANVTVAGNVQTSLFDPQSGFPSIVDPNGSLKTAEVIVLCGGVLSGVTLSPLLWTDLAINGGSRTGGQGEQILSTGVNADGGYILQSRKKARFQITLFNINHLGIQLLPADLEDPNTVFEWGSVDFIDDNGLENTTPNGLFIRVTGAVPPTDPTWEIVSVKDGVETVIDSANFNAPQASLLNKRPALSVYETRYNAGTGLFYQGANFIHKLSGLTETYAATYDFPVALRIRNINGNTTDRKVATRALGTYRLGEERGELIPRGIQASQLIKTGAGYIGKVTLSRTGSAGGSGFTEIYDGIDATGVLMGRVDVGGDDAKSITLDGTYSDGLYIEVSGTGTNTVTFNFE